MISRNAKTGTTEANQVTKTFRHDVGETVVLTFSNAQRIEATSNHPFYVEGQGFVAAGQLGIGNSIVTRAGPSVRVVGIERKAQQAVVYNFEVEDDHTYFVGKANGGIWVHNDCWDKIANLKYDNLAKLGASEQKTARNMISTFQERYMLGDGTPMHQIRNVRNLGKGLYEIKHDSGVRVYLDKLGNVIGYSNKSNQDQTITQLQKWLVELGHQ